MSINYADDVLEEEFDETYDEIDNEEVVPKNKRSKLRIIIAILILLIGLGAIGMALSEMIPELEAESHVEHIADEVIEGDGQDPENINWDHLSDIDGNIKAWLSVDNTKINYPIAQGSDNEYYLHHNVYGEYSYTGVFADCRADVDGQNVIVYGHHMSNGTMFSDMSHTQHQDALDNIGTLHWTTKQGLTDYEPAFAMSVEKHYKPVQKFNFEPNAASLDNAARTVAASAGLSGADTITYEVLPTVFAEQAYDMANKAEVQSWLWDMYKDAESSSSDVQYLISNAERAIVLCTCTSGIGGMPWRTYTVFINTGN